MWSDLMGPGLQVLLGGHIPAASGPPGAHNSSCCFCLQSALDDEEAMRRAREEERARLASERMKAAYAELQATDKARDMREQDLLRLEMQVRPGVGVW